MKNTGKVDQAREVLGVIEGDVRATFRRLAASMSFLEGELVTVKESQEGIENHLAEAGNFTRGVSGGTTAKTQEAMSKLQKEFWSEQTKMQRQLHGSTEQFQKQFDKLDKVIAHIDKREAQFESYVTQRLTESDTGTTIQARLAVEAASKKFARRQTQEALWSTWAAWLQHLKNRKSAKEALRRTTELVEARQVGSRLSEWCYVARQDHARSQFLPLEQLNAKTAAEMEAIQANVKRQERTLHHETRTISARLEEVEQTVRQLDKKKVDRIAVDGRFAALDQRLVDEHNVQQVSKECRQLNEAVADLQTAKLDAAEVAKHGRLLDILANEVRSGIARHEDALKSRASVLDVERKADADLMEDSLKLLAGQADHLAKMLSEDLHRIRSAVSKFLELSPDIRKAALSMGLNDAREQCLSCRAMQQKRGQGSDNWEMGADGTLYRTTAGCDGPESPAEQAARILKEKLRMPTPSRQQVRLSVDTSGVADLQCARMHAILVTCNRVGKGPVHL